MSVTSKIGCQRDIIPDCLSVLLSIQFKIKIAMKEIKMSGTVCKSDLNIQTMKKKTDDPYCANEQEFILFHSS